MKNLLTVCLTITLLSLGVNAQEDMFLGNEIQGNEYAHSHENGTEEATLMVLDKESNLPICRLSDQVQINSEFIPENRIGDVETTTSIEDIRICQEDDVWDAVEEEMLVGVAIGIPSVSPFTIFTTTTGISSGIGCLMGFFIKLGKANETPLLLKLTVVGILGGVTGTVVKSIIMNGPRNLAWPVGAGALSSAIGAEICRKL